MALTATVLRRTPHSLAYTVAEAGTAAAENAVDVPADLIHADSVGPLRDLLQGGGAADTVAFANQAAARAAFYAACDISIVPNASTPAGSTEGARLLIDPDVADANAGGFRLNMTAEKAANGDTADFTVFINFRHSIGK